MGLKVSPALERLFWITSINKNKMSRTLYPLHERGTHLHLACMTLMRSTRFWRVILVAARKKRREALYLR